MDVVNVVAAALSSSISADVAVVGDVPTAAIAVSVVNNAVVVDAAVAVLAPALAVVGSVYWVCCHYCFCCTCFYNY